MNALNENINETSLIALDAAPPVRLRKVRHSKVASLPRAILDKLCHRLEDGQTAPEILAWVNALPEVRDMLERDFEGRTITPQNLSEWRTSGYVEWVRLHDVRDHVEWLQAHDVQMGEVVQDRMGERVARVYALELLATLREALDTTKTPLERFEVLCRGLDQIKGLRQWDNQSARLELQEERWERERMDLDDVRADKELARRKEEKEIESNVLEVRETEEMLQELIDDGQDVDALANRKAMLRAYGLLLDKKARVHELKSKNPAESREIAQNPGKSNLEGSLNCRMVESLNRPIATNPQPVSESKQIVQNPGKSNQATTLHGDKSLADGKKAGVEHQALAHSGAVSRSQNLNDFSKPQLEPRGSLSQEDATRVVEALHLKAKKGGYRVPKSVEVAALRAYLTGRDQLWFNHSKLRNETLQPPVIDPRLDEASPWHGLWKKLGMTK